MLEHTGLECDEILNALGISKEEALTKLEEKFGKKVIKRKVIKRMEKLYFIY